MKLLRASEGSGEFLGPDGIFLQVERLTKEDLLRLTSATLDGEEVSFDDYDETLIRNQAQQIIYRSVIEKLRSLRERRQAFKDESARLFLDDYGRYRDDPSV